MIRRCFRRARAQGRGVLTGPLVLLGAVLLAACSLAGDSSPGAAPTIEVGRDPDNTLRASVTVLTETPGSVELRIETDGLADRVLSSTEDGDSHRFSVVALRSETEYRFTAVTADGAESESAAFTTGALPATAPRIEITQPTTDAETAGVTFFGLRAGQGEAIDGPTYFGVDGDGEIVWYLDTTNQTGNDPYLRHLGGGEVLAVFTDRVEHLTLDGRVLAGYDLAALNGWHHDVRLLDNGNLLLIEREDRTIDGVELRGDGIVEVDPAGNRVWAWSSFDHLDVTRFPGELAMTETRAGNLDWTHANSVWIDEPSGQVLLSLRSQGWVVNIDRASSEVNWIAGDDEGTAPGFDAEFLTLTSGTWPTAQHAAMFTAAGELLVYDNRNESSGDTELSRAVIYEIDATAGTATQVFDASANKYTPSLGDVDELSNGNILLTAGGGRTDRDARLVEVDRGGEVVWEAVLPGNLLYRSERITWADVDTDNTVATPESAADEAAAVETVATTEATGGRQRGDRANGGRRRGAGGEADAAEPGAIPANEESDEPATDITDVTLTSTENSCAAYAGRYTSQVTDRIEGASFTGNTVITVDGDLCTLETDSIPNHDFGEGGRFANPTGEVAATYLIPVDPRPNDEPTRLEASAHAVLLNGVGWHAHPAACFDEGDGTLGREAIGCAARLDHPWRYNIGSPLNDRFGTDIFFAHSQNDGLYHYHQTPSVLHEIDCDGGTASPVIGFARDGFPLFGPCFTDGSGVVRPAESSYEIRDGVRQEIDGFTTPYAVAEVASDRYDGQFIGDYEYRAGSGDLDECNGMTVDGVYGYYVTADYPYVLGCFSGTPTETFGRSAQTGRNDGGG